MGTNGCYFWLISPYPTLDESTVEVQCLAVASLPVFTRDPATNLLACGARSWTLLSQEQLVNRRSEGERSEIVVVVVVGGGESLQPGCAAKSSRRDVKAACWLLFYCY